MNWTRVGIVGSLALCVWVAWPKGEDATPPRPLMIRTALKQVDDPVVLLGDSIVRMARFPARVCGRPIVNAGIDGSTTASGLDDMLTKALGSKKAAMIVVSLGINDASVPLSADTYRTNYLALLTTLKPATSQLAIVTVPPAEAGFATTAKISNSAIESYNSALPAIAGNAQVNLVTVPAMPAKYTTDGVHLNDAGYAVWTKAILGAVEDKLCKK